MSLIVFGLVTISSNPLDVTLPIEAEADYERLSKHTEPLTTQYVTLTKNVI